MASAGRVRSPAIRGSVPGSSVLAVRRVAAATAGRARQADVDAIDGDFDRRGVCDVRAALLGVDARLVGVDEIEIGGATVGLWCVDGGAAGRWWVVT
jgi:hypothetical protein